MNETESTGGGHDLLGDPNLAMSTGRELVEIGGRLRKQSRAMSVAGARVCRTWEGSASIAYAGCSNRQVRGASGAAQEVERIGRQSQDFGKHLERMLRDARAAIKAIDKLKEQLRTAVRDQRHIPPGPEQSAVLTEITKLRADITAQERKVLGIHRELKGLRTRYGNDLAQELPADLAYWWRSAMEVRGTVKAITTLITVPGTLGKMGNAVSDYRNFSSTGQERRAYRALQDYRDARNALMKVPGNPFGKGRFFIEMVDPKLNRTWKSPMAFKADGKGRVRMITSSKAIAGLRRAAGPVGAVFTVKDAGTDVFTGGGKEGVQGIATRATGGFATAGAVMMLFPATAAAGAIFVGVWLMWKSGMSLWDKSQQKAPRKPAFKEDSREQRIRFERLRSILKGNYPDPTNLEHRLYVDYGEGPIAERRGMAVSR